MAVDGGRRTSCCPSVAREVPPLARVTIKLLGATCRPAAVCRPLWDNLARGRFVAPGAPPIDGWLAGRAAPGPIMRRVPGLLLSVDNRGRPQERCRMAQRQRWDGDPWLMVLIPRGLDPAQVGPAAAAPARAGTAGMPVSAVALPVCDGCPSTPGARAGDDRRTGRLLADPLAVLATPVDRARAQGDRP